MTPELLAAAFTGPWRSYAEVGAELGLSRQRVHQLVKAWGIERTPWARAPRSEKSELRLAPRSVFPREGMPAYRLKHGMCHAAGCKERRAPHRTYCTTHLFRLRQRVQESRKI